MVTILHLLAQSQLHFARGHGTSPVRSNLCTPITAVSAAVRNKVTVSDKQPLRNNFAAKQSTLSTMRAQLHFPDLHLDLDLSWALLRVLTMM